MYALFILVILFKVLKLYIHCSAKLNGTRIKCSDMLIIVCVFSMLGVMIGYIVEKFRIPVI